MINESTHKKSLVREDGDFGGPNFYKKTETLVLTH